jgi:predicted RNA-binding protein with RPS1 domain
MGIEEKADLSSYSDLKPNMRLHGTVVKIELFGAFVNVGLETPGLIHISKLKRGPVNRIEDILQEGQEVEVWVQNVDPAAKRLELTMIRPIELNWNDLKPGVKAKGKVVRLENFGAFVDIGAERPGLVHVSEMSSEYVSDPSEILKVDEEIDVVVIDLDRKKKQIRLSIRAAEEIEELVEDEEEVEEPPTAMEVALRKAMSDEPDAPPEEEVSQTQPKKSQNALEDILSRTLQQRVKTSTGDE